MKSVTKRLSALRQRLHAWRARPPAYQISYSQCGEDLIIDFVFQQVGITQPSYLDIGAFDPYKFSNTALFYQRGAQGINIEPDPYLYRRIARKRRRDTNLNVAVGAQAGKADFYVISAPSLNTFSYEVAQSYTKVNPDFQIKEVIQVQVETIQNIIQHYCQAGFPQLLNLDVEGLEDVILRSIDYQAGSPLIICVETLSYATKEEKNVALINFLESVGYFAYADTYINTILVRKDILKKTDYD